MSVRTYVGFVADFDSEPDENGTPAGEELATYIASKLRDIGIVVMGPIELEGYAWDLTAKLDGVSIDVLLGLVDDFDSDPPRQWLIMNDYGVSLFSRILTTRKRAHRREIAVRKYCEALHAVMSSDPKFSHILWHDEKTFDKPDDEPAPVP